jgi:hypothetical protein
VDRTRLRIGENLVFTLRVQGGNLAVTQPALPPLDGFKSVGTYQTLEGQGESRALVFHYLLTPTKTGRLHVPDLSLRIGSQVHVARGFAVEVETSVTSGFKPVQVQAPAVAPSSQDISFVGTLSTQTAYVGQPVLYTLRLHTRRSIRALEMVKTPDFAGFRKVDDPKATGSPTRQTTVDGRIYLDVIVVRATLFPLQAGALQVAPYTALLRLEAGGPGGKVTLKGGGAALRVLPLPPAPDAFTGAVGSFTMKVTSPPPARTEVGQPFSLTLHIEGSGFLPEQPLVWPSSPLFSPYATATEDTSGFSGGVYRTRRTVKASFLPKVTGDALLPYATLVYFDPSARRYYYYEAGGAHISVGGGGKAGGPEVRLAPLVEAPAPGPLPSEPLPREAFWTLLAVPFLLNALLALCLWSYRSLLAPPEARRARALASAARRSLRRARRNLDVRKEKAFHEHLSRALTAALDLRAGRPTGGLSREQLRDALAGAGPGGGAEYAAALVEALERARYAPERVTRAEMDERLKAVETWVRGR